MATVYKKLVEKQRVFFATGVTRNVDFRIKSLKKLRLAIQTRNEQIAEALKKDFGKFSPMRSMFLFRSPMVVRERLKP